MSAIPPQSSAEIQAYFQGHGIPLDLATIERLKVYADLLRRWQPVQNLVAPGSLEAIWERHFLDSVQLLPLIKRLWREEIDREGTAGPCSVVDLGSGAGFPGLALAIACRDSGPIGVNLTTTLVEPNKRKVAFLRAVSRETETELVVHAMRAENLQDIRADFVVSRALAPLSKLGEMSSNLLGSGAIGLFHKGVEIDGELDAWDAGRHYSVIRHASMVGDGGVLLQVRRLPQEPAQDPETTSL